MRKLMATLALVAVVLGAARLTTVANAYTLAAPHQHESASN